MWHELELWRSIASRLNSGEPVMLLVVATSSGSSPGRAGYKMAVAENGELYGSIGGGVMEVNLVEQSRDALSEPGAIATGPPTSTIIEQVHQKKSPNASGMICSGKQTVIMYKLTTHDSKVVDSIIDTIENKRAASLKITPAGLTVEPTSSRSPNTIFDKRSETDFTYRERLGRDNHLFIIGGGHCALALSELMSRLGFRISIFDDRPELNTIKKNEFADSVTIVDSYESIGEHIPTGDDAYVVVMTLGYKSDAVAIRKLIDHDLRYFGVLGSKAKMATLMNELRNEGLDPERLARIHTPIGLPINSRTPDEIAVSIAAEVIAVKNEKGA